MEFNRPYKRIVSPGEINNLPTCTEPDTTMTIPEIIQRFVRGLPVTANRFPQEFGQESFEPDFDPLDHHPSDFKPSVVPKPVEPQEAPKTAENA